MITKQYIKEMPLEEKVAHLIIVRCADFEGRIDEMLKAGQIAGIGAVAIDNTDFDVAINQINDWKSKAKLPVLFYIDGEWGLAQRFNFATRFPPIMAIGAAGDEAEELARLHGSVIAKEAKTLGFHVLANPSIDVNIIPKNPIICTRAFGDDTDEIIRLGRAYVKGMQDEGIIPTGKHYPGHGATDVDSHVSMPQVNRSREELMNVELRPYKEICNDMWGVMTAHIHYPALAPEGEEGVPATMSRAVVHDILRGEFGYDNLIISDSLTMKGIKDKYGLNAAVGAIKAGHDIILQDYASDPFDTYELVLKAARSGEIPMEWIDDSVSRIMKFKEMVGCIGNKLVDKEEVRKVVGCAEHKAAAERIARASITAIEADELPLVPRKCGKTLVIATVGPEEERAMTDLGTSGGLSSVFVGEEVNRYCAADVRRIPEVPSAECVDELLEIAKGYDTVIAASFVRTSSYKENSGRMAPEQARLLKELECADVKFISLIFGNPYVISELPGFKNCLLAYGDDEHSIKATVQALFGELVPTGRLPINVDERYPRGYLCNKVNK